MGRPFHDLSGQRFGRLVALTRIPDGKNTKWRCHCDCGGWSETYATNLKDGSAQSCGCRQKEITRTRMTKHGHAAKQRFTPEYASWAQMRQRCHNPDDKAFWRYGARGIKVCDRWRGSFEAFLEDMGPRPGPGYSVDRIDVDGDYEPTNCRWATALEQGANKRNNITITAFGETLHIAEWCRRTGMKWSTLRRRLAAGWNVERALTPPK